MKQKKGEKSVMGGVMETDREEYGDEDGSGK